MKSGQTNKYVGICIYCGQTDRLTDEHAIPFALKGNRVLKKASCEACNKITTKFENSVLRRTLLGMRTVLQMPTRHKKKRPDRLQMIFIRGDEKTEEWVPIEDAVPVLLLPEIGPPGVYPEMQHLLGLRPHDFQPKVHMLINERGVEHQRELLRKYSADAIEVSWEIDHDSFLRMLAKIAMCEAIFMYGFKSFRRFYVIPAILGRDRPSYWVGSDGSYVIHLQGGFDDSSHVLAAIRAKGDDEVWVRIKLWNKSMTPEYIVVVGQLHRGYARFLDFHGLVV